MKQDFASNMADKLAIPPEAVGGIPLTELRGGELVCIENHRGILEYTPDRVKVAVKRGAICVLGTKLSIVRMTRRRVEIRGCIRGLELE